MTLILFVTLIAYINSVQRSEKNIQQQGISKNPIRVPWDISKIEFADSSPSEYILTERNQEVAESIYVYIRIY